MIQRVSNHPQVIYSWESSSYLVDGVELYEDNSIDIGEVNAPSVSVYPNPVSTELRVTSVVVFSSVELTDLSGKRLSTLRFEQGVWLADVSSIQSGMYLVNATAEDGKRVLTRVIVQH